MMKNVFLLILCILMMACSTTKKSVQSKEVASVATEKTEAEKNTADKLIDTTKTEKGKITITEIEFYPPTVGKEPQVPSKGNSSDKPNKSKPSNASGISLPNIGNIGNAAIKSIKQTTIENETEKKGESKESSSNEHLKKEAVLAKNENIINSETSPAPDPYRWRYIFYILLLVTGVFLYLKRIPVLNWIKTILTNIRQIF